MKAKILFLWMLLLPGVAMAFAQDVSGTCGENLTWTLSDGTLTISGIGEMTDYGSGNAPWYSNRSSITAVIIEDGVMSIGNNAFSGCSSLTSVTIGNVISIGNDAFDSCSSLISITIPNSVTSIGNRAFYYCNNLTSVTISGSVTSIGTNAFSQCYSLTVIDVSENNPAYVSENGILFNKAKTTLIQYPPEKLGGEGFTIPNSVKRILHGAFAYCSLSSIIIPNSVTNIENAAFNNCHNLTSVTIPESVTSLGQQAFYNCSSLTAIDVLENNTAYASENGVLFNKAKTTLIQYPAGKPEANYTIPNSVTSIGYEAFFYCLGLTSITIPNSVTSIEAEVFYNCENLTSVTIPNGVTSIGTYTFSYCSSLTSITIPNGVTSIGRKAFEYCSSLASVTIPNSVKSIESDAFSACFSLTSVTNLSPTPQTINSSVFYNTDISKAMLFVPAESVETYKAAPVWQDFGTIIELISGSHWPADYRQYPGSMTFTAIAVLDDMELQRESIEIGAFSNGECRGSVFLQHYPESVLHPYLGFLVVHGNNDDVISLRIYDHITGTEYETDNQPFAFVDDAIRGALADPYTVRTFSSHTQTIDLYENWNWISVNVANNNPSLISQFKDNIGSNGVLLKGWDEFIQAPEWIGTLSGIGNETMYMLNTSADQTLSFSGDPVDPATVPISLFIGWNWIGYTPATNQTVDEAFSGIVPQIDDQIKSYSDYSVYTEQGWMGTLTDMRPGDGYKYFSNSADPQVLTYSSPMQTLSALRSNEETQPRHWTAAAHRYPNTMTVTSVVLQNKVELRSGTIEIGAFSGDECRGSVVLQHFSEIAGHSYLGFLVIYGEGNEKIQLRVYDPTTGEEYPATSLSFVADMIHGTPSNPYMIEADFTGAQTVADEAIYLKRDGDRLQIRYPWESIDRIELFGLNGNTLFLKTGFTAKYIDISSLANGVYIVKLTKNDRTYVKKFTH